MVIVFQPELGHKENPSFTELGQLEHWNRAYGYVDRGFPETYERLVETAATRCEELEAALRKARGGGSNNTFMAVPGA